MKLSITARGQGEKLDTIREKGGLPAVFYGPKETAMPITLDAAIFSKMWRDAGETTILSLEGVGEPKDVLIHEVDVHPVTGAPRHVDFYVLEKGKKIEIAVPIEFEGVAPAEKEGAVIVKVLHEIEIEVEPKELPQHLVVNLEALVHLGDHISAADVALPPSATLITDPEEIIVSATEQHIEENMPTTPPTEEEAAAAAAPAASE